MCGIVGIFSPNGTVEPEAAGAGDPPPHAPGPGRPEDVDRGPRADRARPRAALHHRPDDRRSADRERGRAAAHRRQRRVLRLRADPEGARGPRPPAPDALRQRDRPAPLRGPRRRVPRTGCAASSRSCSGTSRTRCSSRRATGSGSSRSSTRSTAGRSTWRPRSRRSLRPACRRAGTARRSSADRAAADIPRRPSTTGSSRSFRATTCSRRAAASQIHRYWDFEYPRGASAGRAAEGRGERRAPPRRARRGRAPAAAGRRAGRLLPERRPRFVLRDRPRVAGTCRARSARSR